MAHIELTVWLKHDLPAAEMHALAIDCLSETFNVTDDMGMKVLDASYLGDDEASEKQAAYDDQNPPLDPPWWEDR